MKEDNKIDLFYAKGIKAGLQAPDTKVSSVQHTLVKLLSSFQRSRRVPYSSFLWPCRHVVLPMSIARLVPKNRLMAEVRSLVVLPCDAMPCAEHSKKAESVIPMWKANAYVSAGGNLTLSLFSPAARVAIPWRPTIEGVDALRHSQARAAHPAVQVSVL